MKKCLICQKETEGVRCPYCGYDESTDCIRYRTVTSAANTYSQVLEGAEVLKTKWPSTEKDTAENKKIRKVKIKWWKICLAIFLFCLISMSFFALHSLPTQKSMDNQEDVVVTAEPEVTEEPVADEDEVAVKTKQETDDSGTFETIAEFVDSDSMKEQISLVADSLEGTGMQIDIYGEDNKLVYDFTFEEFTKDQIDTVSLEEELESASATFSDIALGLKTIVNEPDPIVKVVYKDKNGETIYSKEFIVQDESGG